MIESVESARPSSAAFRRVILWTSSLDAHELPDEERHAIGKDLSRAQWRCPASTQAVKKVVALQLAEAMKKKKSRKTGWDQAEHKPHAGDQLLSSKDDITLSSASARGGNRRTRRQIEVV